MKLKTNTTDKTIEFGVVEQVRQSFLKKNRLAMGCGFVLGAFVPSASYCIGHYEAPSNPTMWVLVAGGLGYSAVTVFQWAKRAFKNPAKAGGFCLLLEGVMTFSHEQMLGLSGLALLIIINGIATGATLATEQRKSK